MIITKSTHLNSEQNREVSKKNIIQTIRDKEMDRKDFLKYSGIVLLGVVGLKGVASLLAAPDSLLKNNLTQTSAKQGFGSRKYGE